MTLRDMISRIESAKHAARTEPYSHKQLAEIDKGWDQIIAALRAGQAMADEVPETSYARQAWDAVTKGKK